MAVTRIGVVGYGTGGRHFHTPFIEAADGVELAGIVTRAPQRVEAAKRDWPGIPVFESLADLAASGVDCVSLTTPPQTRRGLVLEALDLGVHVVADKPFAPSAEIGVELARRAERAGLLLSVFHNRRWDADIRTLASILRAGELGELWRVHSRMDQDSFSTLERGPAGGLLRDLGSHVIDQLLWLLGPVDTVAAHLDHVESAEGITDCSFTLTLVLHSGVICHAEASKLNHIDARELRVYGASGSYHVHSYDVQAQAIFAGRRPTDDPEHWGYDDAANWGILRTGAGSRRVPSEQGRYQDFYTEFGLAVRGEGAQPVPAFEAIATLRVLDAARTSALRGGRPVAVVGDAEAS